MQTYTISFFSRKGMMESIAKEEAAKASVRSITVLDERNGYVVVFERPTP